MYSLYYQTDTWHKPWHRPRKAREIAAPAWVTFVIFLGHASSLLSVQRFGECCLPKGSEGTQQPTLNWRPLVAAGGSDSQEAAFMAEYS